MKILDVFVVKATYPELSVTDWAIQANRTETDVVVATCTADVIGERGLQRSLQCRWIGDDVDALLSVLLGVDETELWADEIAEDVFDEFHFGYLS